MIELPEPHPQVSERPGRQPYAPAAMLRMHLLSRRYALGDPAMDEALQEISILRGFAKLKPTTRFNSAVPFEPQRSWLVV
ncbi:transposase [Xanthomonas hortorum]|uniref:transposase n=1 Tax=Xanthomonas hortorum TaxID=56454 RepID=UPI003CCF9B28